MQAPNPWTPSFLDSPQDTSTHACVSLGFNGNNWIDHQGVEKNLFLENPKLVWKKAFQGFHKRFIQITIWATIQLLSNQDFREVWVQNPKTKRGTRGTLISLSSVSKTWLRVPLYSGRSRSETLIFNGLKLLFGLT